MVIKRYKFSFHSEVKYQIFLCYFEKVQTKSEELGDYNAKEALENQAKYECFPVLLKFMFKLFRLKFNLFNIIEFLITGSISDSTVFIIS
jgi:hypothetical protein